MSARPRALAAAALLAALVAAGCGTAVYDHAITVVPAGAPIEVGVFDPYQGDTRDWAHAAVRRAAAGEPYRATVTTTPTVTVGSSKDARPLTFALAVPAASDDGFFVVTIDRPLEDAPLSPGFRGYEGAAAAPPVAIRADAEVADGSWSVRLTVDAPSSERTNGSAGGEP